MAKLPANVVFHQDIRLLVFRPRGILDEKTLTTMAGFLGKEEVRAVKPFNRFTDMSKLDAVDLDFRAMFELALHRRVGYTQRPAVKSAFYVTSKATERVVKIHALLNDCSPLRVEMFTDVNEAAKWLGTSLETLEFDASNIKGS